MGRNGPERLVERGWIPFAQCCTEVGLLTCHSLGVASQIPDVFNRITLSKSRWWNYGINIKSRSFFHLELPGMQKTPLYSTSIVLNSSYWSYSTLVNYSIEPPSSVLETRRDVPEKLLQVSPTEEIAMKVEKSLFLCKKTYPGSMGKCHIYNYTYNL